MKTGWQVKLNGRVVATYWDDDHGCIGAHRAAMEILYAFGNHYTIHRIKQ